MVFLPHFEQNSDAFILLEVVNLPHFEQNSVY